MTQPLIDIGANLTHKSLIPHINHILSESTKANVEHIIVTGTSIEESEQALALAQQHPQQLCCTCGIHPHDAKQWNSDSISQLRTMLSQKEVKASGETGLDFNRNYSPQKEQIFAFEQQIELAIEFNKPLFLHQRDAHDTFFSILKNIQRNRPKIVVHCFTDNKKALFDYIDEDFYIGITGWVCDPKRGIALQQLVPNITLNRIMIESDAPYLTPKTISPKPKHNQPYYLPYVARKVAELYQQPYELIAQTSNTNSRSFFNL